mmetsp:Transcript_19570/g.47392  ORF Transcript_19570/g.47392 Transcript_19570/m.47392 type:complete len:284 (+) Transcript_19570:127-978(+)
MYLPPIPTTHHTQDPKYVWNTTEHRPYVRRQHFLSFGRSQSLPPSLSLHSPPLTHGMDHTHTHMDTWTHGHADVGTNTRIHTHTQHTPRRHISTKLNESTSPCLRPGPHPGQQKKKIEIDPSISLAVPCMVHTCLDNNNIVINQPSTPREVDATTVLHRRSRSSIKWNTDLSHPSHCRDATSMLEGAAAAAADDGGATGMDSRTRVTPLSQFGTEHLKNTKSLRCVQSWVSIRRGLAVVSVSLKNTDTGIPDVHTLCSASATGVPLTYCTLTSVLCPACRISP